MTEENYYSSMIDLEGLDPQLNQQQATWKRDGDQRGILSVLFENNRLDLVQQLISQKTLTRELNDKLRDALKAKALVFDSFPVKNYATMERWGPRALAEHELLKWRPASKQALRRMLAVEYPVGRDWRRRRVDHSNPRRVLDFYRQTEAYIWELMAANNLVETLYNYGVTLEKMKKLRIREFLDYGAGIGTFVIAGHNMGFKARYMDLSSPTLEFARWRFRRRRMGIRMSVATGCHDDLPPSPAIVCTEVVEHVSNPVDLLDAFERAIPLGGHLIVSESCRYLEKFASHLPQNRWLGGKRFDYELRRRGFIEVLPRPAVHPRIFRRTS